METITVVGLIIIGIAIGFILTKGFQCAKEILNINSFVINEGMIGPCP